MGKIALLWDSSNIWVLTAYYALESLSLPYQIIKPGEVRQALLDNDDYSMLFVPGGSARKKNADLGDEGRFAIREYVRQGGSYLGICGGAGLGLSDESLGVCICPWKRAQINQRIHHQMSGNVRICLEYCNGFDSLLPDISDIPFDNEIEVPIWWPGRFEESKQENGVKVVARYSGIGKNLYAGDINLDSLPDFVLKDLTTEYHIDILASILKMPAVIAGKYGSGRYLLSYPHLETPASRKANLWLIKIISDMAGITINDSKIPQWYPAVGVRWMDDALLRCRDDILTLLDVAERQGLLFERLPWLIGWHAGIPGVQLNTMALALCSLATHSPNLQAKREWNAAKSKFCSVFESFIRQSYACLMAQRLASTTPDTFKLNDLDKKIDALFGNPMFGGGIFNELMLLLDAPLFELLKGGEV